MAKMKKFYSKASMALLLTCSVACSQENPEKRPSQPTKQSNHDETAHLEDQEELALQQDEVSTTSKKVQDGMISQNDVARLSEAFGYFIGRNLKAPGFNFDLDSIIKGMKDGYAGKPAPMTDKEYEQLMSQLQEKAFNQLAVDNLKAANEFLEANVKNPDVVELVSGKLQYQVVQEGEGDEVQEHGSPQIKYTGRFLDGNLFGSSEETGGALTVSLDQTIPGFSQGVKGMKEGEKRKLFIHPDLGYGTTGHIPPNLLLIFEVEVVKAQAEPNVKSSIGDAMDLSFGDEEDEDESDDEEQDDDFEEKEKHHHKPSPAQEKFGY